MISKNIFGFAAGPILGALVGVVTVPVTTWIFSPEDIGRLNIFQITISFSLLFSMLGLDRSYVREYHEAKDRAQLLLSCFLPGFVLLILLGLCCVFFARELSYMLYADASPLLFLVTYLAVLVSYVSRFLSLILRMQERGWAYSLSQLLPKIFKLFLILIFAVCIVQSEFVHLQLIAFSSMFFVFVFYAWSTSAQWFGALKKNIDRKQFNALFAYGFPLIFSGLAYWGLSATSTIALRLLSTLDELAVYSVANSFAGAAIVFQSIFSVLWAPAVYKWVSQGVDMAIVDSVAKKSLAVVCCFLALCGSLSWMCDLILPVIYSDVKYILLCVMMQPLLYALSEVTCVGIDIQRKTIFSLWITLAALSVNIVLNYILVPDLGAAGAAISNSTAFTVFFLIRTEVSARIWRNFRRFRTYVYVIGMLVLVIGMVFCAASESVMPHVVWAILLLFCAYLFREDWVEIVGMVISKRSLL